MDELSTSFEELVVLDTETTGLNPEHDEIIEIGAVRLRREGSTFVANGELSCLLRLPAGRTLPPEIVRITGITAAMLDSSGLSRREAAAQLSALLTGKQMLLVAYNAQFDLCFLYYFLSRYGMADCLKKLKFLDALTVYRDRQPYPHRLENAISAYQLDGEAVNSHRAVDDAKATALLLRAMEKERSDLLNYVNLFGCHPRYGVCGKKIRSIRYYAQPYDPHPPLYELALQHEANT